MTKPKAPIVERDLTTPRWWYDHVSKFKSWPEYPDMGADGVWALTIYQCDELHHDSEGKHDGYILRFVEDGYAPMIVPKADFERALPKADWPAPGSMVVMPMRVWGPKAKKVFVSKRNWSQPRESS